jgi:UDP-2,4-diacetamido-2,4,6-trideoxy-beta-L-altropyranose hydrolase
MAVGTLILRADASEETGLGHVMRCLSVAEVWQEVGGRCSFVTCCMGAAPLERLSTAGVAVEFSDAAAGSDSDAAQLVRSAREQGAAWVMVDGYHFGGDYQQAIKNAGLKLLFVDDYGHAGRYSADLVLSQQLQASEIPFEKRSANTRLLLGPRYFGLRREFEAWRDFKREVPEVARKILVTMGGSDPDNVSLQVLQALRAVEVKGLEVTVVLGGSNPHGPSVVQEALAWGDSLRLERNTRRMPELMAWADVGVSAGGGTCYELAFLQTPMFLITIAMNHERTCRVLADQGMAIHGGWFNILDSAQLTSALRQLILDRELRGSLAERAHTLLDGKGAHRVVQSMIVGS